MFFSVQADVYISDANTVCAPNLFCGFFMNQLDSITCKDLQIVSSWTIFPNSKPWQAQGRSGPNFIRPRLGELSSGSRRSCRGLKGWTIWNWSTSRSGTEWNVECTYRVADLSSYCQAYDVAKWARSQTWSITIWCATTLNSIVCNGHTSTRLFFGLFF